MYLTIIHYGVDMKSKQEILEMKDDISKRIKESKDKMNNSVSELQYEMYREDRIRLIAEYNLLIKILYE